MHCSDGGTHVHSCSQVHRRSDRRWCRLAVATGDHRNRFQTAVKLLCSVAIVSSIFLLPRQPEIAAFGSLFQIQGQSKLDRMLELITSSPIQFQVLSFDQQK